MKQPQKLGLKMHRHLGHFVQEDGAATRTYYERVKVLPRMLIDVSARDMSTAVLGEPVSMPILIAPMAVQCLAHPDGEIATTKAAGAASKGASRRIGWPACT